MIFPKVITWMYKAEKKLRVSTNKKSQFLTFFSINIQCVSKAKVRLIGLLNPKSKEELELSDIS